MNPDTKYIIAYLWIISILAAVFVGNEIARITHKMDREVLTMKANYKNQQCHRILAGELYAK